MTDTPKKGVPPAAPASIKAAFDLTGRVAVITGGAGLLGSKHAEAVMELGGTAVLLDIDQARTESVAAALEQRLGSKAVGFACDITRLDAVEKVAAKIEQRLGPVNILINNAANNPKMESKDGGHFSRLDQFPVEVWNADIAVGLTGSFLCSRVFGSAMAARGKGVILNIASDLGAIAPDQRLYRLPGKAPNEQPVKPVTYSVVKHGLIGLTRYLATYWPEEGVRCNALLPGGVYAGQPEAFLDQLADRIPMARMAHQDEYKGAVAFLVSDASSYMNGAMIAVDGGRTAW